MAAASFHPFTFVYAIVNRLGLLRVPFFYQLFVRAYFFYKSWVDDPFAALLAKHPKLIADGNVLDIGANIGYTATLFGRSIKAPWKVIAFEPHPKNAATLRNNVEKFGLADRIEVIEAAVGNQDGEVLLWENASHHADHRILTENFDKNVNPEGDRIKVPVLALDKWYPKHYSEDPVSFIKIDIQGYEIAALQGLEEIIRNNPLVSIAFEYAELQLAELGFNPEDTLSFLNTRGFNLNFISRRGDLIPLTDAIIKDEIRTRGYLDILARRNCN